MKRSKAFATSALALSLGIAGLLPTVSTYAAGGIPTCGASDQRIDLSSDPDEIVAAMTALQTRNASAVTVDGNTITLNDDICVINTASASLNGLVVDDTVNLNLNGHNIASDDPGARTINVGRKDLSTGANNLSINGAGTIAASDNGVAVRVFGSNAPATSVSTLTTNRDVALAGDIYGLMVGANSNKTSYGVEVSLKSASSVIGNQGGAFVNGNVQNAGDADAVKINIEDKVTIAAGTDSGIYGAGQATWTIGAADISGYTGISAKSGTFVLNNTTVTGNGAKQVPDPTSNAGMGETGAAIAIESNPVYAGEVSFTISGGTYTSEHNSTFLNYKSNNYADETELNYFVVNYGSFKSADGEPIFVGFDDKAGENTVVTGGNFSNDQGLDEFLPAGATLAVDAKGNFVVVRPDGMGSNVGEGTVSSSITTNVVAKGVSAPTGDAPDTGVMASGSANAKASTVSLMAKIASFVTAGGVAAILIRRRRQKEEA